MERTVLITGAARRIGRGIAIRLHQAGFRVAIHYGMSEKEARETAAECGGAEIFQANLEKVDEIVRMFGEVGERLGSLYGLVNNAARFSRRDPFTMTEADWDSIHSVNLKATFFCSQQGALLMRKARAGRIVNISSLGGLRPWADHAHYCSSKAALNMLTQAMAKAFAPEISVNCVAPGWIEFGRVESGESGNAGARFAARTPMGRNGSAEEVAEAVLFFATGPRFVTGQILGVDGGLGLV